jgi:hypothetical protein
MNTLKPILFFFLLVIVSCSNEAYEEGDNPDIDVTDPEPDPLDYFPNTLGDYWIYDVESK